MHLCRPETNAEGITKSRHPKVPIAASIVNPAVRIIDLIEWTAGKCCLHQQVNEIRPIRLQAGFHRA
ncbi:MAG: hypothetical protein VX416_06190, partial [Pseudomonadota bacterium]|nr:hypothetical protein [Pseudomonadota bacterium]